MSHQKGTTDWNNLADEADSKATKDKQDDMIFTPDMPLITR